MFDKETYPRLTFSPSALSALGDLETLLDGKAVKDEVLQQLRERLEYLNGYAGGTCEIFLGGDPCARASFSLQCFRDGYPWWSGGLQFEGIPQPFGSVTFGNSGWWSINT